VFLTRELFEAIGRAEIAGMRSSVDAVRRLFPDAHADSIEVGGGLAPFTGVGSPLSKTIAIGISGPATPADVDRITDFYQSRNAVPRVFVTPFTELAFSKALAAAGYSPVSYDNVMIAADPDLHARRDDRICVATDFSAWAQASVRGFSDHHHGLHDDSLARIVGSAGGVIPLEARENGAIVATAGMGVRDGCGSLFAGSTLHEYRNRGWQLAMIRDRIGRAREAGARIISAAAEPASVSERNFHRAGFVTLYTRCRWDKM
jgi:hypothetical protein